MGKTINFNEKLECKGYWWLPNNPNETIAGVLTYIPNEKILLELIGTFYNPQIQISAESETKRSIFRKRDKTKRSKKESAQHSKSRNKSFVMTSVSAL